MNSENQENEVKHLNRLGLFKKIFLLKSIRSKLNLFIILLFVIVLLLIFMFSNFYYRRILITDSFTQTELILNSKKSHLEDYINNHANQIFELSINQDLINAFKDIKYAVSRLDVESAQISNDDYILKGLNNYYEVEYCDILNDYMNIQYESSDFIPRDKKFQFLQYYYLVKNTNDLFEKEKLTSSSGNMVYDQMHEYYHTFFRGFINDYHIDDLLLIDNESGDIIYTVRKLADFGTNIFSGPYKNSNLAVAVRAAAGSGKSKAYISDISSYDPALDKPVLFIAIPVTGRYQQKEGILVFQVSIDRINLILSELLNKGNTSGKSMELNIIGSDLLLRNSPLFDANKELYWFESPVLKKGYSEKNTQIENVFHDNPGHFTCRDYKNKEVLCSAIKLKIGELDWVLISKIDKADVLKPLHIFQIISIVVLLILLILLVLIVRNFSNLIITRINKIKENLILLIRGQIPEHVKFSEKDEITEIADHLNNVITRIDEASDYLNKLKEGNLDNDFILLSEDDKLGVNISELRENLIHVREEDEKRKKEEEIRNWSNQGIAQFNDLLRQNNDNVEKLAYNIISSLVEYISATQGGIFIVEGEGTEKYIKLVAAYAYNRQKFLEKRVETDDGLIGNCYYEKQTIYLKEVPDDYLEITSGLGKSKPSSILIVPLKIDEEVLGIIELASLNEFKPHEIEFVEILSNSFAATLVTVRLNSQTTKLLEESNKRAEVLAQQEEELRQNLEEMQATQEELQRVKQKGSGTSLEKVGDLKRSRNTLRQILDNVPDAVLLKDEEGNYMMLNKAYADLQGHTVLDMIGKSDKDYFTDEEVKQKLQEIQTVLSEGRKEEFLDETNKEIPRFLKIIRIPLEIRSTGKKAMLEIIRNITEYKK